MPIGSDIRRFASLPSTNDTALELGRSGAEHGTAVVADAQTKGRGTKGRSWHSPQGLGLYVSFIIRPDDPDAAGAAIPLLPLAAGLAAADAVLGSAGVEARLKWPNDLVCGKKKLAGILSESVSRGGRFVFAVVGIGVNVNHGGSDFPADLRDAATSLKIVTGRDVDREALLARLCQSLDSWYNSLILGGKDAVIRAYESRMAFVPGDPVRVTTASGERPGIFRGLAGGGGLRLERSGRVELVSLEEIRGLDWD